MEIINHTIVTEFILAGFSENPKHNTFFFLLLLHIYIITILGNSIIIFLIITHQHLHSPMYYLLLNLSAIDILFTSCTIPKALAIMFLKKSISFFGCMSQMYVSLLLGETEFILLAVMAYDRYAAICSPLHYTAIMNIHFSGKIILTSWVSGSLFAAFPSLIVLTLPFCGPNKINHAACEYLAMLEIACTDTTFIQMMLFPITMAVLILPFLFIITSYVFIIRSVLMIRTAGGRYKTFSTCTSHLIVVCISYGSAIALYLGPKYKNIPDLEKYVSMCYGVFMPLLNPIIYSLRNSEIKRALIKTFSRAYVK